MAEFIERSYINTWATSWLLSKTVWWNLANAIVALLSQTEIKVLIPSKYVPLQVAIVTLVNLYLRSDRNVRPIAFIRPGRVKIVRVQKLDSKGRSV